MDETGSRIVFFLVPSSLSLLPASPSQCCLIPTRWWSFFFDSPHPSSLNTCDTVFIWLHLKKNRRRLRSSPRKYWNDTDIRLESIKVKIIFLVNRSRLCGLRKSHTNSAMLAAWVMWWDCRWFFLFFWEVKWNSVFNFRPLCFSLFAFYRRWKMST